MSSTPNSRYDNAYQDDVHQDADAEAELRAQPAGYEPVLVRVESSAKQAAYSTVIVPASTSAVPGVAQLLPRDPCRTRAYIMPVDYPIVIATTEAEVQSPNNVGASFPNGGYIGSGFSPPIFHHEPVYCSNTSTAGTTRVVVWTEYE